MCAPTRMQLYTGIYPLRNGAYGNHTRVYEGVKSAAHYFRELGYRVGISGKGHIFPHKAFPFERSGKANNGPVRRVVILYSANPKVYVEK
jgi:N-sulfoglucosamine sulfohydrolase